MALDPGDESAAEGGAIQSVVRAADILRLLTSGASSISVAEASKAVGLQRTTTHRYMTTLVHVGFLQREKGTTRYTLGPLSHQVFTAVLRERQILTIAPPQMQILADQESISTALCLWGGSAALVAHVAYPASREMSVRVPIGLRVNPDGAQTLMFMAFNDDHRHDEEILNSIPATERKRVDALIARARSDHFVQIDEPTGIRIIAVPVFDSHGICATLAMLSTVNRLPSGPLSSAAEALRLTASKLSGQLGSDNPHALSIGYILQ